jgi:hypothetical protein
MKTKLIALFLLCAFSLVFAQERRQITNCRFNNTPLHGRVMVVARNADFRVQVVTSMPDLRVQRVESMPNRCGMWQFVNSMPDFTIEFVNSAPDFTIEFVESSPGAR